MAIKGDVEHYSLVLKRVEYQLSAVESGEGAVTGHKVELGRVTVIDDDGTRWVGWEDHTTVLQASASDVDDPES